MSNNYDTLVGPQLRERLLSRIQAAAKEDCTVLITGESGTGKELVAEIIYKNSQRRTKPFIIIDFSTIPKSLMPSELFGHKRGSFTNAFEDRNGLLYVANKGTAFLDEFAELSRADQANLLRFLETGNIKRLGTDKFEPLNVRAIIATTGDLENKLKENKIRSDLYYRITRSIRIDIPPLRDHKSDLLPLFKHFFEKAWAWHNKTLIEIDQMVPELLSQYSWPGNVRELRNFAEDVARWLDKDCKRLDREKLLSLECLNKENLDIVLLCNEAKPFVGETFSKRHIKLFQYALGQQIEKFSISEYIRFCINHCRTKISKATALRDLKKLCEIGLIEPFGGGRTSGYRILPRQ